MTIKEQVLKDLSLPTMNKERLAAKYGKELNKERDKFDDISDIPLDHKFHVIQQKLYVLDKM